MDKVELNAYLNLLQHQPWSGSQDNTQLVDAIVAAVFEGASTPVEARSTRKPQAPFGPAYAAPLPPPGGTLDEDDPWYIVRTISEQNAMAEISETCRKSTIPIKGPRQMGKSSLLLRLLAAARKVDKRVVLLDFQLLGSGLRGDQSRFFRHFAASIARQAEVDVSVDSKWSDSFSESQNCTNFIEDVVLPATAAPLTLGIDEADSLLGCAFSNDFFAMLRSWHNVRRRGWAKMDLVLATSTEPYLFIDDANMSPFNVGLIQELGDFTMEQVSELNSRHPQPVPEHDLQRIFSLLHGHPFLTRKALYLTASSRPETNARTLIDTAHADHGPFGDHLRHYLLLLTQYPKGVPAFRQILGGKKLDDAKLALRLEAVGLARSEEDRFVPRCELYVKYFKKWI